MEIKKIVTGDLNENCYVVFDPKKKRGVVIDPGDDAGAILKAIEGLKIEYIFLTHTHFDHILGLEPVVKETGAKVVVHERESEMVRKGKLNPPKSQYLTGKEKAPKITGVKKVKGGEAFKAGTLTVKVLATPGHTPGGMSVFINKKAVFVGDTLFARSIGRTDLLGGDHETLMDSIEREIFSLPAKVEIYPGHGSMTTVKARRQDFEDDCLF